MVCVLMCLCVDVHQFVRFIDSSRLPSVSRLRNLQARVKDARMKSPLFDTREYTRGLETLFTKMWHKKEKGLPADHVEC